MTLMLFVYFICSIVYIVVGILAFVNNKKSRTNQMFFIAAINMTFWSLCLALMSISKTAETAALFRKLTWISYSTVYAQFLYFVFALTGKEHLIRGIWRKALFYTPAVVSLVLSMIRVFPAEYMQQTWYGWAYIGMPYEGFMWEDFFNLYYITYVIFGIILLFAHWRDAKLIRERKRSKIIALSFSSALVLGTFSDIILPRFAKTVLPPFAVIIIMAGILAILYSMREHGLMSISAERVAREISRVTNEGVLIFDHNDKLISANPGAQRKLKFSQEELQQEDVLQSMLPPPLQSAGTPHENMECELTCADGAQLPVLVNAHVLRDRFGDKMGTVLNFRDITEVRKVKDELIRQKENLARTVEERTSDLMASKRILEKEIELRIGKENIIKNMAYYDQLTGLPNRRMFNRTLTDDIESA